MSPPTRYETTPLLGAAPAPRRGLMTPATDVPAPAHGPAIRNVLWLAAAALGAAELILLGSPGA